MKLAALFEAVRPYFEGRIDHAAAAHALWGEAPGGGDAGGDAGGVDGERLAVYARFCRNHRFEVLALFEETRAAVLALGGEAAWESLVEDYFVVHPMRHFELFANGAAFPSWLAGEAVGRGLPSWLAEVADAEWWRWSAEMGPDAAAGEGSSSDSALRIAPTVELRAYVHDVPGWLAADEETRSPAPNTEECVAIFWRDRNLEGRCERATPVELAVLKMVSEGLTVSDLAAATGLPSITIVGTRDDLSEAGILTSGA